MWSRKAQAPGGECRPSPDTHSSGLLEGETRLRTWQPWGRAGLSLRVGWESRSLGGAGKCQVPSTVRQTVNTGAPFSQQGELPWSLLPKFTYF